MCGIAGVYSPAGGPPSVEMMEAMASALHHRGPDEFGYYRDENVGLAHARLSIIDLASGQQPLANEDETIWISYNGEIFNHVELRQELEARGHRFRTRCDTEVIVHAFEEWGDDAFDRFNGQFAFALWDTRKRRLTLVRDRYGVRPLHVCAHRGRVFFASEAKAIFAADPAIPRALDPHGIEQTFTFWSPLPPSSIFAGIEELRPGWVRHYSDRGMSEHPYWELRYPPQGEEPFAGDIEAATEAVRDAMAEATRLRMVRSDVPVGSYLSGGLDSSLVAALGVRHAGRNFKTFSIRFEDKEYDETGYQRAMSAHLGSDHHELMVTRRDIAECFPDVVFHTERPTLRTAPAPLFLLSREVQRAGIKVVLTGEGADEVFAGYDIFREGKVRRFWARNPEAQWRAGLLERLYPYLSRSPTSQRAMARQFFGRNLDRAGEAGFAHGPRWHSAGALRRLLSADVRNAVAGVDVVADFLDTLPADFASWSPLSQDQWIETKTLLGGYLLSSQGDRVGMAHSIEGRFPFLDVNVGRLAASLPPRYRLKVLDEKHVLKRSARDLVPASVLDRKKQPYRAPDALAFIGHDAPAWVDEVLKPQAVRDAQIFDPAIVEQLWRKCRARPDASQLSNSDNMALVGVLSTQLLHRGLIGPQQRAERGITFRTRIDRTGIYA